MRDGSGTREVKSRPAAGGGGELGRVRSAGGGATHTAGAIKGFGLPPSRSVISVRMPMRPLADEGYFMTQIPYATPPWGPLPFKDRRAGLRAAGVILLVLGALAGCMGLLMPVALFVPQPPNAPRQDWRNIVIGAAMYVGAATFFIWAGIDAIRLKRWVRPLILIGAWTMLLGMVASLLFWLLAGPGVGELIDSISAANTRAAANRPPGAAGPPAAPPAAMVGVALAISGAVFLLFLLVPAGFVAYFRLPGVRKTLEFFDPRPAWTDACPTPALAVSLSLLLFAVSMLSALMYPALPAFGLLLTGLPAAAAVLAEAAVALWLAWLTYRLRMAGWWGTLAFTTLLALSWGVSAARLDWQAYYRAIGYSPEQIEFMGEFAATGGADWVAPISLYAAVALVYLLYVRRFFTRAAQPPAGGAAAPSAEAVPVAT